MLPHFLAKLTSALPSPVKYKLKGLRPAYTRLMKFGQSRLRVQTIAGPLSWEVDELTSQRFILGTYEPYMQEAFAKYVQNGATVYDVGAHAGYHSLVCALLVGPSGRVVAFEPNPANRESVKRQLSANPEAQVTLSPYALSDRCESLALDTTQGSSQGYLAEEGDFIVEARQLDFLIEHEGFPAPAVIKIDVEGHELKVLMGSVGTVQAYRPIILCDPNDETTSVAVSDLLSPFGYRVTGGFPIICLP
jgi:FkbM family methyltransferase